LSEGPWSKVWASAECPEDCVGKVRVGLRAGGDAGPATCRERRRWSVDVSCLEVGRSGCGVELSE